jgi:hypothetical protein
MLKGMKALIPVSLFALASTFPIYGQKATSSSATSIQFTAPQNHPIPGATKLEGPSFFDYDKDGVIDLISGNYHGNVFFRKNIGTNETPQYNDPIKLKCADGTLIEGNHW